MAISGRTSNEQLVAPLVKEYQEQQDEGIDKRLGSQESQQEVPQLKNRRQARQTQSAYILNRGVKQQKIQGNAAIKQNEIQRIVSDLRQQHGSSQSPDSNNAGYLRIDDGKEQEIDINKDLSKSMLNFVNTYGLKVQKKTNRETLRKNFTSELSTAMLSSKERSTQNRTGQDWLSKNNLIGRNSLTVGHTGTQPHPMSLRRYED